MYTEIFLGTRQLSLSFPRYCSCQILAMKSCLAAWVHWQAFIDISFVVKSGSDALRVTDSLRDSCLNWLSQARVITLNNIKLWMSQANAISSLTVLKGLFQKCLKANFFPNINRKEMINKNMWEALKIGHIC